MKFLTIISIILFFSFQGILSEDITRKDLEMQKSDSIEKTLDLSPVYPKKTSALQTKISEDTPEAVNKPFGESLKEKIERKLEFFKFKDE